MDIWNKRQREGGGRGREGGREGEKQVVYIRHSQITACIGGRRTPYVRMESFWRNIRFLRLSFLHIKHHHTIEKEHLSFLPLLLFCFGHISRAVAIVVRHSSRLYPMHGRLLKLIFRCYGRSGAPIKRCRLTLFDMNYGSICK